ncbi:MAG: RICIN domain-containing protein [Eubacteriales bacterium]|nr:RICIN domain-containing protein [Eubacteriales bacterium]
MKRKVKRILSLIIALVLVMTTVTSTMVFSTSALSYSGSVSYKSGKYYAALSQVTLTGNQRVDIVNIAKSQVGYQESGSSSSLSGEVRGSGNYTEYGRWYGMQDMWCAMFVSWCANVAGVSTSVVPSHAYTPTGLNWFINRGLAYSRASVANGGYTPQAGDIIYFKSPRNSNITNHVGIVTSYSNGVVYTVEGNTSSATVSTNGGAVAAKSYSINDTYIVYICKPNYTGTSITVPTDSKTGKCGVTIKNSLKNYVFDAGYYSNAHADLKSAYGTDADKLYQHFLDFGIKEGRQAHPVFDVKYYLSANSDLKSTYGEDYAKGINHYLSFGYKESRKTAEPCDLGSDFYANITSVNSGKNLSLSDTNVIIYTPSTKPAQVWKFIRQADGSYKIINMKDGKSALNIDGGKADSGANLQIYSDNDTKAQRFYIYDAGNSYIIKAACSKVSVLDVEGGKSADSTNVRQYEYNGTTAQQFRITKTEAPKENPFDSSNAKNLGDSFYAKIGWNNSCNVGIGSKNVVLVSNSNNADQYWRFVRQSDGSYEIINQRTGELLEVAGGNKANSTNVQISADKNTAGQRWFIFESDSKYILKPVSSDVGVMDVSGSDKARAAGTNIHQYEFNNSDDQKFTINKVDYFAQVKPENVGTGVCANISSTSTLYVGVTNANVLLKTANKSDITQSWIFNRQADGSYVIVNRSDNKAMDLKGGSTANNTNIQTYTSNGTTAQKWFIYRADGRLTIRSAKKISTAVDVASGKLQNGTNIQAYAYNGSKAQMFDVINITENIPTTYRVTSPYNTNCVGTYSSFEEAKRVANSKTQYGYVVYDSTGACVYTPTSSLNASKIVWEAKWVADYQKKNNYLYGHAQVNPAISAGTPNCEKLVSCDRLVCWALYRAGWTDQPYKYGLTADMCAYLRAHGYTQITNKNNLMAGDIVFVGYPGQPEPYGHVFIYAGASSGGNSYRYDAGSTDRIRCVGAYAAYNSVGQPFNQPLELSSNAMFRIAYRAPATGGNIQTGSGNSIANTASKTGACGVTIPDSLKHLVFDASYYSSTNADLKAAYGTDADKLYKHFLDFGIKEGRKAHPSFDIKYYLSANADLKAAYGTDYAKGMRHYLSMGCNENRRTAPLVDLGAEFYGNVSSSKSGKNLTVNGTNVVIYDANSDASQVWKFVRQSDGSYKLLNQKDGKALDVESSKADSGTNVQVYTEDGTKAQRWFIYQTTNGYILKAACTRDCVLDIAGGSTSNNANVQQYKYNGSTAQAFKITKTANPNKSVFEDMTLATLEENFYAKIYWPKAGLNLSLLGNDVITYPDSNKPAQIWRFEKQSDSSYKIINQKTGYVLEVAGASTSNGANVQIAQDTGAKNQRFFIYDVDGRYVFRNAATKDCVLDIKGAATAECTSLQQYKYNNSQAQKFAIIKSSTYFNLMDCVDLGDSFYANIVNYSNPDFYVGVTDSNVVLEKANGSAEQVWKFVRQSDASYEIISMSDGLSAIDVQGASSQNSANIRLYADNDSKAQRFYIYPQRDGYVLRPACSSNTVFDIAGGKIADQTNIATYTLNGSAAQIFNIKKTEAPKENPFDSSNAKNLGDSFYAKIGWNNSCNVGIGSKNVVLVSNSNNADQYWRFVRQSDGSYEIINQRTGELLEVAGGNKANSTNVQISADKNTAGQRWFIFESDSKYILKPVSSDVGVMDVSGSDKARAAGTNIHQYEFNNSDDQKFTINKVDYFAQVKPENVGTGVCANISSTSTLYVGVTNANVLLKTANKSDITQSWIFNRQADGSYVIVNRSDNKAMDLKGGSTANNTNIQTYTSNGTTAQKWFIYRADGRLTIRSAKKISTAVDVASGKLQNGTNIQAYAYNGSKAQMFDVINITENIPTTYRVTSPYNTNCVGTYSSFEEAKRVANSKTQYGYVVYDSTGACVYTPTSSLNASKIVWEAKWVADYQKKNNYLYGHAQVNPAISAGTPNCEKLVSCDRLVCWALYRAGWTDQPYKYGLTADMCAYLRAHGYTQITNKNNLMAGDIVFVGYPGQPEPYGHVFIYAGASSGGNSYRYDAGSTDRIRCVGAYAAYNSVGQPFNQPLELSSNAMFRIAYRAPATGGNIQTGSGNSIANTASKTGACGVTIPDSLKHLVFDASYYSSTNADLKAAYGTDADKLYKHFLDFGIKEGRKAHPSFDIKYYLSANADLKAAYGTDYAKGMRHYLSMGCNENRRTAPLVDLGAEFYGNVSSSKSGKNLTVNGTNVVIYDANSDASQVWKFVRQSDGSYKLLNQKDGKALDVESSKADSGTNVQVYTEDGTKAQRWFIYQTTNGYILKAACTRDCVLDIAGGSTSNNANVQQYKYNGSTAQAFKITKTANPNKSVFEDMTLATLEENFYAKIYWPKAGLNLSLLGNDVITYPDSNKPAQIWRFEKQSDSSYKIINQKTGYVLEVAGASTSNGANVQIAQDTGAKNQRWYVYSVNDKYVLRPASSTKCVLDVRSSSTEECTKLNQYTYNGSSAQMFDINELDSYLSSVSCENLGENFYAKITPTQNKNYNLSLSDSNVILYSNSSKPAQVWYFDRQSDGSYKIVNMKDGKRVLDIAGAKDANNANVQIYDDNGTRAQRYFIYLVEGSYVIRPVSSATRVLTVENGVFESMSNISISTLTGSKSQLFKINVTDKPTAESTSDDSDMAVLRKIIYAVETGGQVYGNVRYDAFTEAYANSELEHAITIGGGQWFANEAKRLLNLIRTTYPNTFNSLDTEGIAYDLDNCDWSTYKLSAGSAKAKCIQRIISSPEGISIQDKLIDEQMTQFMAEARDLGVTDLKAQMMCANIRHLGGLSAVKRVLGKTLQPYTLDNIYNAMQSDTGNQVGAPKYRSRHVMVYNALNSHISN